MSKLEHSTSRACVLLVDDHAPLRRLLRIALEGAGLRVLEAATVADAAAWLGRLRPRAVVLSLQQAESHGLDLLEQLRAFHGLDEVPVAFLAGDLAEDLRWRALRAGADWFSPRPFSVRELQMRVADLVRCGRPRLRVVASRPHSERKAG